MAKRSSNGSKFAGVLHKLTRIVSTEPQAYQDKVEIIKTTLRAAFDGKAPSDVARRFTELRHTQATLEAELYDVNLELKALSQLLVESQENGAEGWGLYGASPNTLRLINGDTVRTQPEPYTATEDRDLLRQYFIDAGMSRILAPPWQTVNALNKERLLNGEAELPGTKLYLQTKVIYTPMAVASVDETAATEQDM